jgi:hypothetical protein
MADQAVAEGPADAVFSKKTGPVVDLWVLKAHKMLGHSVRYRILQIPLRPPSQSDGAGRREKRNRLGTEAAAGLVERARRVPGPKGGIRSLYRANPDRVRLEGERLVVLAQGEPAIGNVHGGPIPS